MQWLDAALAFAVTMLVFSTMVSILVETLHRLFGLREKGLKIMLDRLFHHVIKPQISRRIAEAIEARGQSAGNGTTTSGFAEAISLNRAPVGPVINELSRASAKQLSWTDLVRRFWSRLPVSWIWNGSQLKNLTLEEFMERLGSCEIGQEILDKAEAAGDAVLQDIAMKYDAFSKEAREYFSRRARLTSVLLAICFSLYLQLDAIDIFTSYLRNPDLRNAVIVRADIAVERHQEQQKALQTVLNRLENHDNSASGGDQGELKIISANLQTIRKNLAELQVVDLNAAQPKFITDLKKKWESKSKTDKKRGAWDWLIRDVPAYVLYIFTAGFWLSVFTGLLIGLGGPFWHDTIQALSQLSNLIRAFVPGETAKGKREGEAAGRKSGEQPEEVRQPQTPVDIFKTAVKAAAASAKYAPGRPLIAPDGTIEKA